MNPTVLLVARLLSVPVFVFAGFAFYGNVLDFFASRLPLPKTHSLSLFFGTLIAQGFLAAAATAVLFCYPLAYVYRKWAAAVALAMAVPVLAIAMPELMHLRHPFAVVISAYDNLAYVTLLTAGSWLAHGHLVRQRASGHE